MKRKAFTLIELLLVIVMTAIVSVLLAFSFINLRLATRFTNEQKEILDIFEKARSLSLSTVLVGTEPTEYYKLIVRQSYLLIEAHGATQTVTVDRLNLEKDLSFDSTLEVYYFPPYGTVCLSSVTCTTTSSSATLILSDAARRPNPTATFTIDARSGTVNLN